MDPIPPTQTPFHPVGQAETYLPPEVIPDLDDLPSEDGKPVDNVLVERLYKLLIESLYASWAGPGPGRTWLAFANVGWHHAEKQSPFVPDILLSLDVHPCDPTTKRGRSYIQWVVGKQPDLLIEFVSDRTGGEATYKFGEYARLGVPYYVIYDPDEYLDGGVLRAFQLSGKRYVAADPTWFDDLNLGLTLWEGTYLGITSKWLRWCDQKGHVLPTSGERAERLQAQLRALGIEPEA